MNSGNNDQPTRISKNLQRAKEVVFWVVCFVALSSISLLILCITFFSPARLSRLDIESLPRTPFGLVQADVFGSHGKANGIDIVFVHGLGSDPDFSWSSWVKDPGQNKTYSPVCWIRELLPDDIPPQFREDIRLFFYNHDTHIWKHSPQSTLETLASSMLSQLQSQIRNTDEEWTRKLIFVGHSYGGLIIKQAIVQAFESDRFMNIAQSSKGYIFLGAPHFGSKSSRIGYLLSYFLSFQDSNTKVVGELSCDNDDLRRLHRRWLKITSQQRVVNFYEERKSPRFGKKLRLFSTFIVEPRSASYDSPSDRSVENIPLPLDHFGLNKYHKRDSNYNIVKDKLNELISSPLSLQEARLYVVPVKLVSNYIERTKLSEDIERKLRIKHEDSQVTHALLIKGLGGTGKSQLALNYIKGHKHEFDAVFWIDADNEESMKRSFLEFTKALRLQPDHSHIQQPQLLDFVSVTYILKWFEKRVDPNQNWLVVIDNADNVRWGIKGSIPQGSRGSIIITSQDSRAKELIDGSCEEIEVGTMNHQEAKLLLLKNLGVRSDVVTNKMQQDCDALLLRLGGLAIAIDLASAVVRNYHGSISEALSEYVALFDEFEDKILQDESAAGLSFSQKTVWTVWNTALQNVDSYFSDVKPSLLLVFLAHFRGTIVQDNIFRYASLQLHRSPTEAWKDGLLSSELHPLFTVKDDEWKSFYYRRAKDTLLRFHLLQRVDGQEEGVTMHNLVKWRARLHIPDQNWSRWNLEVLIEAMDYAYHENAKATSAWYLTDHLTVVDEMIDSHCFDWRDKTSFRLKVAIYYVSVGEFSKSESILLPAIGIFQSKFQNSQTTAIDISDVDRYIESLNILSGVYRGLGELDEAEKTGLAALKMHQNIKRPNGHQTLVLMNSLALTYEHREEYSLALDMQAEAMNIGMELLRDDHPQWLNLNAAQLTLRGNMAMGYLQQGQLLEAQAIIIPGLDESQRLHGDEHAETLRFMHLLGISYSLSELYDEAIQILETTLETAKRTLGPHSPLVLHVMTSLASLYRLSDQNVKAVNVLFSILQIEEKEKELGSLDILAWKKTLGHVLLRLNRSQEAVQLLAPALSLSMQVHGEKSPITRDMMTIQSVALIEQGHDVMMTELLNLETEMFEMVWRPDKLTPVDIMFEMFQQHLENGRIQQAETLITRTVEISREVFGTDHEKTLYSIWKLIDVRITANKSFLALEQGREAVEISEKIFGPDHRSTLTLMETLKTAYRLRNLGPGASISPRCPL